MRASSAIVFALVSCMPTQELCDPRNAEMAAKLLECRLEVQRQCADMLDEDCPVVAACDDWVDRRCGVKP